MHQNDFIYGLIYSGHLRDPRASVSTVSTVYCVNCVHWVCGFISTAQNGSNNLLKNIKPVSCIISDSVNVLNFFISL